MTQQRRAFVAAALAIVSLAVAGCLGGQRTVPPGGNDGGTGQQVTFEQDGSSTVFPIAEAWAEEYEAAHSNVKFSVKFSGTGSGMQKFCRGEVQIGDASRPISSSEKALCATNSRTPFEIQVAIDGLAVVVSKDNAFVDHLTVTELNKIWTANASRQVGTWAQVRSGWPDQPIKFCSPGTNSGTFDYFREVIIRHLENGTANPRNEPDKVTLSEDDNVLVSCVRESQYKIGYFGLAYATANAATLKVVPIDDGNATNGAGAITPTPQTVEDGTYKPLSRPLFMYTNGAPTGELRSYFEFGLGSTGQALVEEVGYIKLPPAKQTEILNKVRGG